MMMVMALMVTACGAEETAVPTPQATPERFPASVETAASEPAAESSSARDDMPWPQIENAVTAQIGLNDDQAHGIILYDSDAAMSLLVLPGPRRGPFSRLYA